MSVVARTLLACIGIFCFVGAATASPTLLFDNSAGTPSQSDRVAGYSPGAYIEVTGPNPITISNIAVLNDLASAGSLKFLIFDRTTTTALYISAAKAFGDDGAAATWKMSDALSITLLSGHSYDIGAIADVAGLWNYDDSGNSMNGLISIIENPNFRDFDDPSRVAAGGADGNIRLYTSDTVGVPEPPMTLLFGAGLVALLCLRKRETVA